jgi:hypothetical protein
MNSAGEIANQILDALDEFDGFDNLWDISSEESQERLLETITRIIEVHQGEINA